MNENKLRSALIMKLSRDNVEVHNLDKPIWKIDSVLSKENDRNAFEVNDTNSSMKIGDTVSENINTPPLSEIIENTGRVDVYKSSDCQVNVTSFDDLQSTGFQNIELDTDNSFEPGNTNGVSYTEVSHQTNIQSAVELASCSKTLENHDRGLESDANSDISEVESEPFGSGGSGEDPDYNNSSESTASSSSEDETILNQIDQQGLNDSLLQHDSPPKKRGRKRRQNKDNWRKNVAKRLRNSGLCYESLKVIKKGNGFEKKIVKRDSKKMLSPCNEKCRLICFQKFTEEDRQKIFDEYWGMGHIQRQRDFIASCMECIQPKYRYEKADSRRRLNHAFYFEINGQKRRVCKIFFMSTLGINSCIIRTVIEKQEFTTCGIVQEEKRGKHGKHKVISECIKEAVRDHIKSIPRVESHYCRARTQKEYIEGTKTIAQLHRDYQKLCEENGTSSANYQMYHEIFNKEFNISFFFPKKDACEVCVQYQNSSEEEKLLLKSKYDTHLKEKTLSRLEKENDKKSSNNTVVSVYDLQSVLPCPTGNASSFYYVSKLGVYNFTISNLSGSNVCCYVWHEAEAHRGSNEIGSCLLHYLDSLDTNAAKEGKSIDVIFYSDNCAGQNKNRYIFALYMYAVRKYKSVNSIIHKFLISGHTQNEGDNVHSVIEKQISRYKKSAPIYGPDQYVTLIRQAKKTGNPYQVFEMTHVDFYDLKHLAENLGFKNFCKNDKGEALKISDLKVLKVEKDKPGVIFYKNSYEEQEYSVANLFNSRRKSCDVESVPLKMLYKKKVGLQESKKKGIMALVEKNIVPKFYGDFFKNL